MTIGNVFDFFINQFVSIFSWFYNLPLPITENVSIPFGSFLLAVVSIAICVRIFFYFNDFTDIFISRDDEGRKIGKTIYHNGQVRHINYHDNYYSIQKSRREAN